MSEADTLRENLVDKLGEAYELVGEAAEIANKIASALPASNDFAQERVQARGWALLLLTNSAIPTVMAEAGGEELEETEEVTIVFTKTVARQLAKVAMFVRQLESADYDNESIDEAVVTLQAAI